MEKVGIVRDIISLGHHRLTGVCVCNGIKKDFRFAIKPLTHNESVQVRSKV